MKRIVMFVSFLCLLCSCSEDLFNQDPKESVISLDGDLNFGNVEVNQSSTRTLTISNTGDTSFTVLNISNPNGFSSSYNGVITAGNSVNVTVTFSPTTEQNYNGKITVNSDSDKGVDEINCFGNGIDNNPNPIGILKVNNNTSYLRYFRIKKQNDPSYNPNNQITISAGQTSYYYNLATGIYQYEADNTAFYATGSPNYSSGQFNITSGDTASVTILQ